MFLFMIVGKKDAPLFEAELQAGVKAEAASSSTQKKEETHMPNFIIHASLDVVEEAAWKNPNIYLRVVDKQAQYTVSSYVTAGHTKFMLLHVGQKSEEAIRLFFVDVHELYLKILMNPCYQPNSPITSKLFRERVQASGMRRLGEKSGI